MRDVDLLSNDYESHNLNIEEQRYIFQSYKKRLRELDALLISRNRDYDQLLLDYKETRKDYLNKCKQHDSLLEEYNNYKAKKLTLKERILGKKI